MRRRIVLDLVALRLTVFADRIICAASDIFGIDAWFAHGVSTRRSD
jgi:hypothetical protein